MKTLTILFSLLELFASGDRKTGSFVDFVAFSLCSSVEPARLVSISSAVSSEIMACDFPGAITSKD